ncbi:oxidoreductase-like domain-containing protein [Massilia aurea]|uniref:oxidoreductase-like domain-containing protein n=1 Tax=Massilia aurea TaxID=373040 RepID=UPI003462A1DD
MASRLFYAGAMSTPDPFITPPQPPSAPELDDCCRSGCNPCVFDLYDDALERYERALAAWKAAAQPPSNQKS